MPNEDRLKLLLSDLGRATLRGVRRCPKCGTYNGTRGLSCKNKSCDVVFKEAGEKRKLSTEACKLITGNNTQVYSVRVRDKGPDYRGFVQLPVVSGNPSESEAALITHTGALCFVDTCQRSFDATILKCHEKSPPLTLTTCQHIQAALKCFSEAQPLTLKNSVLRTLNISPEIKESIWMLLTETTGPLVQRVSKCIMAVKCKASPKHPLGYLHFSFFTSRLKDRVENKYFCSCTTFKIAQSSNKDDPTARRCLHFYACICAFASDPKLTEEFSYYINLDQNVVIPGSLSSDEETRKLVAILNEENGGSCEVEIEVYDDMKNVIPVTDGNISGSLEVLTDQVEVQLQEMDAESLPFITSVPEASVINEATQALTNIFNVKRKRDESAPVVIKEMKDSRKIVAKKIAINSLSKKHVLEPLTESDTRISFIEWLGSVTERINQTMHFAFSGKPDPLVFHVPQLFFDCLRERISGGGKKKRLPNFTTGFTRRDAIPLGTFTKYAWHITNILHVKQIFETPHIPLEITRNFVQNRDGTYEAYNKKMEKGVPQVNDKSQPIKPLLLKTFLKVGNTSPDQSEPTPFLIEWIPDILPQSKIGELRLQFEFGHQRFGCIENG